MCNLELMDFFMTVLLDRGATNNFLSKRVADELGSQVLQFDIVVNSTNGIEVTVSGKCYDILNVGARWEICGSWWCWNSNIS